MNLTSTAKICLGDYPSHFNNMTYSFHAQNQPMLRAVAHFDFNYFLAFLKLSYSIQAIWKQRNCTLQLFVFLDSSVITCQYIFRDHCYLLQCISFYLLVCTSLRIFDSQFGNCINCVSFCSLAFINILYIDT